MEIEIRSLQVKKISWKDYEKYFMEALKSPDVNNIIFYKTFVDKIKVSFSWDNFIIFFEVGYDDLKAYYGEISNDGEVRLDNRENNPYLNKFLKEFLFGRGIREV